MTNLSGCLPPIRQQIGQFAERRGGDAGQCVAQVGEGFDMMTLAGGDEAEQDRSDVAAVIAAYK